MCLIAANPGNSQKQLADWAGITSPGLVGVVDELERRGLVARVRSLTDRRRNSLVLSEEGERTMQALLAEVSQIEAPVRDALGQADMRRLIDLIDRALQAMHQRKD